MKTIIRIRWTVLIPALMCGWLTSGCWPAHGPSAYQQIDQCVISNDVPGVAAILARDPAAVNAPEDHGETPLYLAALNCNSNVAAFLLEHGAKVDAAASDQGTPLHLAAQRGCADLVTLLLAHKASINAKDDQGRTPLKRAEEWNRDAVVQLLKANGGTE